MSVAVLATVVIAAAPLGILPYLSGYELFSYELMTRGYFYVFVM